MTNDEIVARPSFLSHATSVMEAGAGSIALQLRMKQATARAVLSMAEALQEIASRCGSALYVNDRVDVAAAVSAGVQLGARGIPVRDARAVFASRASGRATRDGAMPVRVSIGYSAHDAAEAVTAAAAMDGSDARDAGRDGADFVILGTIWDSASHVGAEAAGVALVRETASRIAVPVYAIGGVTPARAREAIDAGAHGVAVITGVWNATDPVEAVRQYLEAMQVAA